MQLYSYTHSLAEIVQSLGGSFWVAPLQNPCRRVSQKKHNPLLGSTQFLLCSSQRANLRLALDLLPKMAGLELAHPQAPKLSHLATWKTRSGGIFPAVTAFILLNLARGVQRVMPGLFTPAGMNPPMLRVQRWVQLLLTIWHLRQSVGSESSFFCSSVSVFFLWKNHQILSGWLIHESEDVCVYLWKQN